MWTIQYVICDPETYEVVAVHSRMIAATREPVQAAGSTCSSAIVAQR